MAYTKVPHWQFTLQSQMYITENRPRGNTCLAYGYVSDDCVDHNAHNQKCIL